ncbi:Mg2+ or Co2+ transporter CorB [Niallia circulans]|nr:CNNM domain-containing protein [Shouchella clausii]SPU21640.1 Mg2+ or Co2+ transporter CorB [Niallia circulans]
MTVAIIVFAEVLPKSIAASFPDKIAYFVSPVIRALMTLLKPITYLLNLGTGALIQLLSKSQPKEKSFSKEELRTIVDIASGEGTFEKEESHRIKGILDFRSLNVNDAIKTPRIEIVGLQENTPFEEARDFIIQNRYTRYPIYREDMDSIIGIFHSKALASWSLDPYRPLTDFSDMEPLVVFEFQSIELVFRKMMQERKHMAIV